MTMPAKNKRRVVIGDKENRGVRHGRFPRGDVGEPLGPVKAKPRSTGRVSPPTGDRRHMTKIRLGVLDTSTVFSKARLAALPVDPDVKLERDVESEQTVKEVLGDLSGREEGTTDNASAKPKTAKVGVRRQRRKVGKKVPLQPAAKAKPKATKKKVTKPKAAAKKPVKRKPVKRKVK